MLFMGFAAALMVYVSDSGNYSAMQAKTTTIQKSYQDCLAAQAAQMYQGKDTDELAQALITSCTGKFDAWVDSATRSGFPPQTKTQVLQKLQPTLLPLAHQAIALRSGRPFKPGQVQPAGTDAPPPTPEESGPITRHAPPPEPESTTQSGRSVAPVVQAAPLSACGGVSVPSDPSALRCR